MDLVLLKEQKIELTLLVESVVMEGGWSTNVLRAFDGGLLVVCETAWKPNGNDLDVGLWWRVSRDGGETWQPYIKPEDGWDPTRGAVPFLCFRRDGSVIGWGGSWDDNQEYKGRPGQPITQSIVRASSWEAMTRGQSERVPARIWLPYMVPQTGDDLKTHYSPAIWGKMVETEDGCLIQGTYPVLAYNRVPRLWGEQTVPASKYRTCVIYSQDDGATWHYLATVASPDQYPLPAQSEGYCEPDLMYFGNGRLLCVMRSGGNPTANGLMERYTPLVAGTSDDGGLSWTNPALIAAYGVKPVLLRMRNGLVACLAGRPGFFLIFSADEGRSWSTPHWVSESHGPWGRCASGYGELIELEPGVLGVAYDEFCGTGAEGIQVTKFRRYRVS